MSVTHTSFLFLILSVCYTIVIVSFFSSFKEALSRLNAVITHPNAQHSDKVTACFNAVSARGKIFQFHRDSINVAQVHHTCFCNLSLACDHNITRTNTGC